MEFPNIICNNSFLCDDKCLKIGYNKLSDLCNQTILDDGGQMVKNNLEIDVKVNAGRKASHKHS